MIEDIGAISELRGDLKVHGEQIQIGGMRLLDNSIHATGGLTYEDWRKAGLFIQKSGKSSGWWLGDLVLIGEERFGEQASQIVDSAHFAESTLKACRWVAHAIPVDRRVEALSFEHHKAVSRLKDPKEQDRWLKKAVKQKWNPTDLRRAIRSEEHEQRYVEQEMPEGRYRVLYVDPPWEYGDRAGSNAPELTEYTGVAKHYPSMSLEKIKALPVRDLVGKNGALFIWVPAPLLPDVFDVISAWGFAYKTNVVWDKELPNLGHYLSVRHEHLILATRGKMIPESASVQGIDSVQTFKRSEVHSSKPAAFRDIIDTLYPPLKSGGDRLEMFAREVAPGWKQWGNEDLIQHDAKRAASGDDTFDDDEPVATTTEIVGQFDSDDDDAQKDALAEQIDFETGEAPAPLDAETVAAIERIEAGDDEAGESGEPEDGQGVVFGNFGGGPEAPSSGPALTAAGNKKRVRPSRSKAAKEARAGAPRPAGKGKSEGHSAVH